jgi:hypothetical protein
MCDMGRMRAIAITASSCVLVAAGSSTQHSAVYGPVPVASSSSSEGVQQYLNAVHALCDGLEQKITALNGGQFDISLKDFLAQLPPAHQAARRLRSPARRGRRTPGCSRQSTGTCRLHRIRQQTRRGATAGPLGRVLPRISAEQKSAASDPSTAARDAAGFSESCNAR